MAGVETFTPEERTALSPHFTSLDGPVFALVDLPEVVKGALFARYSRSAKSLRRLFLDEFLEQVREAPAAPSIGTTRAEQLYERVFSEYGDDSVAQLGGVHLACEGASNILTKVLEWGRLMAYLEQSTRYVPYTDKPDGRWKYHVPAELDGYPLRSRYVDVLDRAFETYARWIEPMREYWSARFPKPPGEGDALQCGDLRYRSGVRGAAPPHARSSAEGGSGLRRADVGRASQGHPRIPEKAGAAGARGRVEPVFRETREQTARVAQRLLGGIEPEPRPEVTLTDFDPDGEVKVVAAALYAPSDLPDDQLLAVARKLGSEQRRQVLEAYVGRRENRRHKPGRAFERTSYRFDVLGDYGAFRDLQRHRVLSLEWQPLSPRHGDATPEELEEAGALTDWTRAMEESAALHDALVGAGLAEVAPYAVAMAYRVRFYMELNAREAMHIIELRTAPQGHPAYRRICQAMHRLIAEQAGHRALAAAMSYVDFSGGLGGRMDAERAAARRRSGSP